jgi:hypothetical protein
MNGTVDTRDYFYNNTCVQGEKRQNAYISMWFCGKNDDPACKESPDDCTPGMGVFYDNKIFQPNRTVFAQVQCGIPDDALLPLANFTAEYGVENGTTYTHDMPSSDQQVKWAWDILGSGF